MAAGRAARGLDERFASAPATMRKAMSASVIESEKAPVSTQMLTCWMFVINARLSPKTKVLTPVFCLDFTHLHLGRAVRGARRCDEAIGRVPPHTAENEAFGPPFFAFISPTCCGWDAGARKLPCGGA